MDRKQMETDLCRILKIEPIKWWFILFIKIQKYDVSDIYLLIYFDL